mmetsp:Transcript_123971/g.345052  ORF Transcript_123971/g.345052 Transcript_123971/m.345052 type:complete len:291 (-) Transcript_123971:201-1073(-)
MKECRTPLKSGKLSTLLRNSSRETSRCTAVESFAKMAGASVRRSWRIWLRRLCSTRRCSSSGKCRCLMKRAASATWTSSSSLKMLWVMCVRRETMVPKNSGATSIATMAKSREPVPVGAMSPNPTVLMVIMTQYTSATYSSHHAAKVSEAALPASAPPTMSTCNATRQRQVVVFVIMRTVMPILAGKLRRCGSFCRPASKGPSRSNRMSFNTQNIRTVGPLTSTRGKAAKRSGISHVRMYLMAMSLGERTTFPPWRKPVRKLRRMSMNHAPLEKWSTAAQMPLTSALSSR